MVLEVQYSSEQECEYLKKWMGHYHFMNWSYVFCNPTVDSFKDRTIGQLVVRKALKAQKEFQMGEFPMARQVSTFFVDSRLVFSNLVFHWDKM